MQQLLKQIEEHHEKVEAQQTIKVACAKCKQWIANARIGKLEVPFTGAMFEPRVGCESWPMPAPDAKGMDLVCPQSITDDPMDQHLFIPHIPGKEERADELMIFGQLGKVKVRKHTPPPPEIDPELLCACGCGELAVRDHQSGNRYATLGCHTRWVFQQE